MLQNIQSLRVIFMGLVITAHLEPFFVRLGWIDPAHTIDSLASDGFLLISAFILSVTAMKGGAYPLDFLKQRLVRLVPLYWLATAAVATLALCAPQLFQSTKVTAETLFKSLFFIPYVKHDATVEPIVFVGWTMNYIVWFIALTALALAISRAHAITITALVAAALYLIGRVFQPQDVALAFFTHEHVLNLALGAGLARLWGNGEGLVGRRLAGAPLLLGFGLIVAGFGLRFVQQAFAPGHFAASLAPVLALAIVVGALALEKRGFIHTGALKDRLASASFSIYLTHSFITVGTYQVWVRFFEAAPMAAAFFVPGAYIGAALVGLLCLRFVERPLDRLVRQSAAAADDRGSPKGVSRNRF